MSWLNVFGAVFFLLCSVMSVPVFLSGQGEVFRHLGDKNVTDPHGEWGFAVFWLAVIAWAGGIVAKIVADEVMRLDSAQLRSRATAPLTAQDLRIELLRFKLHCDADEADAEREEEVVS